MTDEAPVPTTASVSRRAHSIRWWTDKRGHIICTVCGRHLSHVAFTKRDGTLIDFDYHYDRTDCP